MMKTINKILSTLILLGVSLLAIPGFAQWFQVDQNSISPTSKKATTISYSSGILWAGLGTELWQSKDTGKTWKNINFPIDNPVNTILRISFYDDSIGVVTSKFQPLYLTTNQGNTWQSLLLSQEGSAIFTGTSKKICYAGFNGFFYSEDQGRTWSQFPQFAYDKLDILFSSNGKVFSTDGTLLISNDSGTTWIDQPGIFFHDSWSFDIDPCNDNIQYIANENFLIPQDKQSHIFKTSDMGLSWKSVFNAPLPYLCGSISTARNAVYLQTSSSGILRSTDQGQTWKLIGGPSNSNDTRLIYAFNENEIVGIGIDGTVWITYNSGGDPVIPPPFSPAYFPTPFKRIISCLRDSVLAKLIAQGCGTTTITDLSLSGKDSIHFSLGATTLPMLLRADSTVVFKLGFDPNQEVGSFKTFLHIKGFFEDSKGKELFDTLIAINATSDDSPPQLSGSPNALMYDTLSTCQPPQDTTVTLTNKGCDTLEIISGPGILASEFSLITPLTLPLKLAPDSSITITFRFKPSGTGRFVTTAKFTALQQTLTQDISLNIEGYGEKDVGVLAFSPKQFNFKSLTICAHDSASGFVANIGCDSLQLDPAKIFGNPDYKVVGGGLTVVGLKPNDTIYYEVYLNPAAKGLRKGYLVLNSNDGIRSRRDSIPFSTTVTDGTRILAVSTNAVDFGKQSLCDPQKDTVVTIHNTGCDTLQVSGVGGLGSGFGTNTTFPITILPGDSAQIDIFTLLDTVGGKLSNSASLTFTSNSDNTIPPITLSHSFIAGVNHNLGLFLDATPQSGGDLSTVTYTIKESPGKSFSGAGVNSLNFDLNYNTDVLNFTPSKSSANLSSVNGKNFTITGSPITADANGILASVGFTVYLTKDSTTNIILTNRNDTTLSPCGITTLTMSGSATFDYQYLCGERSISSYLRDNSLIHINSIHPNPAQDELEIDLQSRLTQDANVEIFNALGIRVYFDSQNLTTGDNKIHLITKNLSSGVYLVKVGGVSQSFVKAK